MNILKLFKRCTEPEEMISSNVVLVKQRISHSQEAVYSAVGKMGGPVNGLAVARYMAVDSASVTPRLAELTKKGCLKVAYTKRGLDGIQRRFYVIGGRSEGDHGHKRIG